MTDEVKAPTPEATVEAYAKAPAKAPHPMQAFDDLDAKSLNLDGIIPLKSPSKKVGTEVAEKEEAAVETSPQEENDAKPPVPEKKTTTPPKSYKTVKAFFDEGEPTEYRMDGKIEYTVNGAPVTRTLEEIIKRQSSVENTDLHWNEVKRAKDEWKQYLAGVVESTKKGDGLKAIVKAVADQGMDPVEFTRTLREQLIKSMEEWSALTPEQRKVLELEEEKTYYKSQVEKSKTDSEKRAEQDNLLGAVKEAEKRYQMPDGSWSEWYEILNREAEAGRFDKDFTIEDVGRFYRHTQNYRTVTEVLGALAPDEAGNTETINDLLLEMNTRGLTKEDLEDVIREVYAPAPKGKGKSSDNERAGRNLSEKLSKNSEPLQSPPLRSENGTVTSNSTGRRSPLDLW